MNKDILIHLKNVIKKRKKFTFVNYNKQNFQILKILKEYGYILNFFEIINFKNNYKKLKIELNYSLIFNNVKILKTPNNLIKINYLKYESFDFLKNLKNQKGLLIVLTTQGIMSHISAKFKKLGGILLYYIY